MKRDEILFKLFSDSFDILVIGAGATGAGIALDATLRGYKTALIDAADFASGASGNSTKLLHGGVRYLEMAIRHLDPQQIHLVKDCLQEREVIMTIAPHLTTILPIILPAYGYLKKFYYYTGLKIYESLSGTASVGISRMLSAKEVLTSLPTLKQEQLKGGVLYYDGQFDDGRLNISLIQTAITNGCVALNYMDLKEIQKYECKACGVYVCDKVSFKTGKIQAKILINATGCFADSVRTMDQTDAKPLLSPSRGTHIVLAKDKLPIRTGCLIPRTRDGRVLFCLPWQERVVVGTTDRPAQPEFNPQPTEDEIKYCLDHLNEHFSSTFNEKDILSAWTGIRPLYKGDKNQSTSNLSRDHFIERSSSTLYSIVGGKWTTYRLMAQDLLDTVIKNGDLAFKKSCSTKSHVLVGAEGVQGTSLLQQLLKSSEISKDTCFHLLNAYGNRSLEVLEIAKEGYFKKLHPDFPYIEAEVVYILHNEYPCYSEDILYRRLRLGSLDKKAVSFIQHRIDEIQKLC